jgi:GT2 family glycosyltransferase
MAQPAFSATIVTFRTPPAMLEAALRSLARAVDEARASGALGEATVYIVDNGPAAEHGALAAAAKGWPARSGGLEILHGHGNVGYGRANNLAIGRLRSDVHLVMNPDVELAPDALRAGFSALAGHEEVGLVAPAAFGDDGARQYLCKRYPTVWVLFLRGFAPASLRRRHRAALDRYEMRDVPADRFFAGVPLASGCFMLARTPLLREVGGFDPAYFMYFEDYDLSLRIGRLAQVAYVPQARIVHHGGEAARKGARHVGWFVRSAWRFFSRHGWKLA